MATAGSEIKRYCDSAPLEIVGAIQYPINRAAAGAMPIANILFPRTSIVNMTSQGADIIITTMLIPSS